MYFKKKILVPVFVAFISLFAACSSPVIQDKPNIIFIMSDDHAYQALSAYNSGLIETPNIDKIASEGIIYQRAFVTNSICAPSRAVILTGKFSHLNGVKGNKDVFDGSQQTIPKIFQQNGYQTAIVGKWHLESEPTGFDYWNVLPGQGDYYNPDFIKMGKDTVYKGYVTDIITELSKQFLNNRQKDKPFFLMMHHKAPHRSWMPAIRHLNEKDGNFTMPNNFYDDYSGREPIAKGMALTIDKYLQLNFDFKLPVDSNKPHDTGWFYDEVVRKHARFSDEEREAWDNRYNREKEKYEAVKDNQSELIRWKYNRYIEDFTNCIKAVDESVGEITGWLEENGLAENTIVIYTSDQGFFLGEHGFFDKRIMYEEAFRTPLLIKYPNEIDKNSSSELLVQNLDIAPTLLDLAGVEIPDDLQGRSLRKTWSEDSVTWRDALYYHYYEKGFLVSPHYGIRTKRYKLIHFYDEIDSWELFDLQEDPKEMNNLVSNPEYSSIVRNLKEQLSAIQEKYKDNSFDKK
ncbi:MAG: sulfatase [Bacteroidota bacterium]